MDWKRFAFITFIIIVLFSVVVLVGSAQSKPIIIIASMLASTITVATPLTLGALSGIYCERSGVVNIGIEGMMLTAAFFGWLGSIYMNSIFGFSKLPSLLIGVLVAVLSSVLMALLHAVLSITYKVDQIIGGTVINIMAIGITGFLNRQLFFESGSIFGGTVPHAPGVLPIIHIPVREGITAICGWFGSTEGCLLFAKSAGQVFDQQPITIAAILLVIITHFVLFKTRFGLRMRSVGEHPRAADTVGINVERMRYISVLIGGVMAGLGGAYFTLESVPSFEPMMTNGRGFIALAAMIFGNWTPFGAWAASLVFGAAQALLINMQIYRDVIPPNLAILQNSYVVGLTPYILTMLILTGIIGKTVSPAADGTPYEK